VRFHSGFATLIAITSVARAYLDAPAGTSRSNFRPVARSIIGSEASGGRFESSPAASAASSEWPMPDRFLDSGAVLGIVELGALLRLTAKLDDFDVAFGRAARYM